MKKKILIAILAAAMMSAAALAGCGSSEEPAQTETTASTVSAEASSSDETPSSSAEESPSSAENSAFSSDFEAVFAENPLDADYETQMEMASTTQEIISVANTFTGLWSSEITNAYALLIAAPETDTASLTKELEEWNNNFSDEVEQVRQSVEGDGSTVQTERAIRVKDLYRETAKALYARLYQIDPDYTYAYTPY